jgi:dihydrofolate synthase / folylpolyglutamate synthase
MTYGEVLDYLFAQLPMFHRIGPAAYKPDLSNTIALCNLIGNPQNTLRCVHIAGTNGKGSTSHLIASSLQEAGYKTALCTSPHLKDFRERIRINGEMIPESDVIYFVEKYKDAWTAIQPSFFEMTIALSFWYFAKEKVDIAVIETGLGGRLDSTNVISPEITAITNIGYDHMNLLGDTLEKIAAEKAGIIKEGIPVILGEMKPNARSVIESTAKEKNAPIIDASLKSGDAPATSLQGYYQEENRRTAYQSLIALRHKGWNINEDAISRGFQYVSENTGLMGRWQILGAHPLIVADVAHNEDGVRMLMKQVEDQRFDKLHVVIGMVADKDISKVLSLLPKHARYYFCKANIPRGLDAKELAAFGHEMGLKGNVYSSVDHAFTAAKLEADPEDMILVGGSVFTVAEVV